ncbi:MAG: hypothetical protein LBE74_07030 [Treponema sp.]|jgi:hypothetical protein|nr:hypothetical protein [Treponema sp.]
MILNRKTSVVVLTLLFILFFGGNILRSYAYIVEYKEQFYRLYHLHYIQYPDDTMENIYYLEKALKADFANPLFALALIENTDQWEKYKNLFMMHLNLKMIEQYLFLGNKWNKRKAYFYNAPWKRQNLESLDAAEACYRTALSYWNDAKEWAKKASARRFRFVNLERVQFWQDESGRIEREELNYGKIITRELNAMKSVREQFQSMKLIDEQEEPNGE